MLGYCLKNLYDYGSRQKRRVSMQDLPNKQKLLGADSQPVQDEETENVHSESLLLRGIREIKANVESWPALHANVDFCIFERGVHKGV